MMRVMGWLLQHDVQSETGEDKCVDGSKGMQEGAGTTSGG